MVKEFTRDWFQDRKNQVHTIQDAKIFNIKDEGNIIKIGEHFLVDLIPYYGNGNQRSQTDVEIWEVENSEKLHNVPHRGKLHLKPIRKVTMGKQFGYPNGYWKVPEFAKSSKSEGKR